ncbi:MAG: DUF2769 domain-containing protein [Candidatus Helarchaeota archaeon]
MSAEDFKASSFEEKMEMIYNKMSERQKRESREQIIYMCKNYCGRCPSYLNTGEKIVAFCMEGKSSLITEKKGCLCDECPISNTMSLRWRYYCMKGSAVELSQSEKQK